MNANFDFTHYVETKKHPGAKRSARGGFGEYAYSGDLRVLRSLSYARPVRLAVEASVRAFKAFSKSDLLGQAVRVSAGQFPRIHEIVGDAARELHIPAPVTYVGQNLASLNAATYGVESDSFILVHSATVDRLNDAQLRFVIGHECGHIQNSHVTYGTALHFLTHASAGFVRWIVTPASVALKAWSRRAEITCDRAGLLVCRDLNEATRTLIMLAGGAQSLVQEVNVEAYLAQLDDLGKGLGRVSEYFHSHPYLPKRLRALQLFAESEYYRRHIGLSGGRSLADVDRDVDAIISVL